MFKVYSNIACRYLWRFLINKIQTTKYTTVCTFQFHLLEVCIMELKAYCFLGPKILDIVPTELKEVKTLSTLNQELRINDHKTVHAGYVSNSCQVLVLYNFGPYA